LLGCLGLNIVRSTVQNWNSLEDIIKTFKEKGFKDVETESDGYIITILEENSTFLKIIEVGQNDFSYYFRQLDTNVQYLLLVNSFKQFLFVKEDYSITGRQRRVKFKFSKEGLKNSTLEKLNALQYNDIHSFDSLFDTKAVVKEFYKQFKEKLDRLVMGIKNIANQEDRERYAQIIFYRLIFLHFIQTKRFLSEDRNYLLTKLSEIDAQDKNFYNDFLKFLFFEVLNKRDQDRKTLTHTEFQNIPYLNGGLFREHRIEIENPKIWIGNEIFNDVLSFLAEWVWYVDENADFGDDKSVSPEILGHIFEKTITNQKEKGAYYTPSEVTNYIAESTILKYCADCVNENFSTDYRNIREVFNKAEHTAFLYFEVIKNLTILDNACGSGAFLLAAQKLMYDLYVRSWEVLRSLDTAQIKQEREAISKYKSENYYFKRSIITKNIYGVDLEDGAIEICKLRLWLSMVSEIDRLNAEPLPNIDYNIVLGNSLVGYLDAPREEQLTLEDNTRVKSLLEEIDAMKRQFQNETDPERAKQLKNDIDNKVGYYDRMLNKKLAAEFAKHGIRYSAKEVDTLNPLHWRLKFSNVFTQRNGFDIIIGNPPYVETSKIKYPIISLQTEECGNVYAYFFEISLRLLRKSGYLSFIVPISSICTDRMGPLQDLLISKCKDLFVSSYDNRPGHIFDDIENIRYAIIVGKVKKDGEMTRVFTSKYYRWYTNEWLALFKKIQYVESTDLVIPGIIPKVGTRLELDLLKNIRKEPTLACHLTDNSKDRIWYHNAPRYWIRATDFTPKFKSKDAKVSSHLKELAIDRDSATAKAVLAVLNSSLFYWFFIISSNCRDLTLREIQNFNINLNSLSAEHSRKLAGLADKLMMDYKKNSIEKVNNRKSGKVVYQEFYPGKSKHIIDQIDDVLADHYGFTEQQKNFIKSFDKRFRMGEEDGDE